MRKEEFSVGSFVHVYNRGNRKQPIVHDVKDRWRFLQMLYYFNSNYSPTNMFRELHDLWKSDFYKKLEWPNIWQKRKPIVQISAYALLDDHYHLLLKEILDGGITKFMRKLGTGMTNYYNTKYNETGRLFQGAYKARVVGNDDYLKYLSVYIQVKNVFELYPGGLKIATKNFDKAFDFSTAYPYCSLTAYAGKTKHSIIDKDVLGRMFKTPLEYKEFARECIEGMNLDASLGSLCL